MNKVQTFTEGTLTRVPLKCVVDHPEIEYRELDQEHVTSLSKDIERNGLDQPIVVWNGGGAKGQIVELDGGKRVPASFLVAGLHRRAALKGLLRRNQERYRELFPSGIPVIVRGGDIAEALTAQLRENVQRKEMSAEQILPVVKRLIKEFGMKQKEVARRVGKSEGWVSQILDIEDTLGEEATEELKKGGIKLSEARDAARKVKESKKKGKAISGKEALSSVKAKADKRKAAGRQREERRVSPKQMWARYIALPKLKMGEKLDIAESALAYLAGDEEYTLASELQVEVETRKSKKADDEEE